MTVIQPKARRNNDRLMEAKSKMLNSNPVKFNFNLPRHIHQQFKMKCVEGGNDMGEVMRQMIVQYINYKG